MLEKELYANPDCCSDCGGRVAGDEFITEVNPPGGYGRQQVLVCDDCMKSGKWDHWISEHWPNWPEKKQLC